MASGGARISMVGLLPQEEEDEEEDAGEAATCQNPTPMEALGPTPGVSNAGFEPGVLEREDGERKKNDGAVDVYAKGKSPGKTMEIEERCEEEGRGGRGEREKGDKGAPPEKEFEGNKKRTEGSESRVQEVQGCSQLVSVEICRESKREGKEGVSREERKRSPDVSRLSAGVVLGVSPMNGASRASESPHRRRAAPSTALRRRRVEDSRGPTSLAVAAWGPPPVDGPPDNVAASASSAVPGGSAAPGTRVPSNSAPGPSRPSRRSSGPRCQEALSSILWEPYDCRRRRPTLLGGEGYRVQSVAPTSTFYYHAPLPHPLDDYALWLPPPPYEASTALPLDGPPPNLPDFFPITFSSCSSASSSAASSLSTSPSSSSSFLCCSTANGNTNRFSIDVATARRAAEKAAEEATEAALRRARSFQCLPPEGSCVAVVNSDPSRLPLPPGGKSGALCNFGAGGTASEAVGEGAEAAGGGDSRAEANRKSALVADLGGEESWCPYCLARPREALGSSRAPRGRCRCKSSAVECSSRWGSLCTSREGTCGGAREEPEERRESRRGKSNSRCDGRERCPRRSRGRTPAAEMVSVAVEGVRGGGASVAPPDEEAPPGAGEQIVGYGAGSATTAANGGDASAVVGVVNVVNCRAAAPATLRVPVPAAQRCVLVGNVNVSNVRISTEAGGGGEREVEGAGGEQGRTFTSTEAQTDETGGGGAAVVRGADEVQIGVVQQQHQLQDNREQRRRERRERRHRRSVAGQQAPPPPPPMMHSMPPDAHWQTRLDAVIPCGVGGVMGGERLLPDLLNSHLPPPYSTLPMPPAPPPRLIPIVGGPPPQNGPQLMPPPPPPPPPGSPPQIGGMRFPFPTPPGRRCRGGLSRGSVAVGAGNSGSGGGGGGGGGAHYAADEDGPPKSCCGLSAAGVGGAGQPASVRWFVLAIAFVGVCCALVGTVLGALKATGREHLTVSLLMIGVGIVLITVSGVAWRLTSHDAPSCRMMLGLGGSDEGAAPNRRFVPRLPPSYGRPHHPYAAMMYPEFQYRPPPPSYQASMQEYRLRLLLLDRHPGGNGGAMNGGTMGSAGGVMPPPPHPPPPHPPPPMLGQPPTHHHPHHTVHTVSPPPTYRSYAGSTIREWRCRAGLGLRRATEAQDHSRPPSYRSRASSSARPTLDPGGGNGSVGQHSRDASLSLSYLSATSHDDTAEIRSGVNPCDVSVINVNSSSLPSSPIPDNLVLMMVTAGEEGEEKKRAVDAEEQHQPSLLHRLCSEGKDPPAPAVHEEAHLVTIVQTTDSESCGPSPPRDQRPQQHSQCTGQGEAVIVTVSGSTPGERIGHPSGHNDGEIEILAHL